MSGLEDEVEQKAEQEVKEKVDSQLGGQSGGQQGGGPGDSSPGGGDPNQAPDPNAGDQSQANS